MIQLNIDHGCMATMGLGSLAVDNLAVSRILNVSVTGTLSIATDYKGTLMIATKYKGTLLIAAEYKGTLSIDAEYKGSLPIAAEYKGNACSGLSSIISMSFDRDTNFQTVGFEDANSCYDAVVSVDEFEFE